MKGEQKMYNWSLLEETLKVLKDSGVRPEDVQYVLTSEVWMTWEEFANIAKKVHYDSGYGIQEIESSLKVVGIDWWLERAEYDGAEWWKFCTTPVRSAQRHDPNASLVCKWFEDEVEDEEICKIANDCDRLRDILYQDDHKLTVAEIQEICDLLWDYRVELLNKEVQ
nr:MAG: hypothetical protein [Bacteriophage sp.]